MKPNYGRLIDDHKRIEASANEILRALQSPSPSIADLCHHLETLRFLVAGHLELEQTIVDACSDLRLARSWVELMETGRDDFQRLCCDWQLFLENWNFELITADLDEFRIAARDVLLRLTERVQIETRTLYATGLQMGAIALR